MKKVWLFGSYNWQGNVKALFLYMEKYCCDTHELWWVADNTKGAELVRSMGYQAVSYNSVSAQELFQKADVYVNENVRVKYPSNLNPQAIILNLWHGVGIKHVELGLGMGSKLTQNIMKKYITHYQLLKNQMKFLVTSELMEQHFMREMPLDDSQIIRGSYPRNSVYQKYDIHTFDPKTAYGLDFNQYQQVFFYAPTWRNSNLGLLRRLLPNLENLNQALKETNSLFILKMHPHDVRSNAYQDALSEKSKYPNILFWNDEYDIYEIFDQIDVGIVDYSSIFYDLMDAGVKKFIRYIPDHESYLRESELVADFYESTSGVICHTFTDLLNTLTKSVPVVEDDSTLLHQFFEYNDTSIDDLIATADHAIATNQQFPELHTFDIFDTVIRRNGVEPESVFYLIQAEMKKATELDFPTYLVECYHTIRHDVEMDTRIAYRQTTFERDNETVEVTLDAILDRLQEDYCLTDAQRQFLFDTETSFEIQVTEPRQKMIEEYFRLKQAGNDVLLVSDMYLPESVIHQMVTKADSRFANEKIYLSATLGYQKSLGTLFEYVFFDIDYRYSRWVHHGDNKRADGSVPRSYGIVTYNHDMDTFRPYEKALVDQAPIVYRNDAYRLAKKMQQYRWYCIDEATMTFHGHMYYNYAYIGSAFVPYVYWSLKHAIKAGYQTLYFISRDGHFLKQIADVLIEKLDLNIKSKYIYASRKVWRIPSFVHEVDPASFTPFGMFSNLSSFDELVSASQLDEQELLDLIPELENYRDEPTLKGSIAIEIRQLFEHSTAYQERLLEIAAERRPIVLDYIKQEIDFDEKFAFVEFWGRGYTQDTFTRLLEECIDGDFKNPFYYVRNFTDNIGKSVRHRFTTLPYNFSYYEPIFAQTPYKSIAQYQYEADCSVSPVIIPQENDFHEAISHGLQDFARDFADFIQTAESGFSSYLAEFAYKFQFKTPLDSVIVENLSVLKDNVGIYGEPVEFAPIFTQEDIKNIGIENFKFHTSSLTMSMARSDDDVREKVNIELKKDFQPKESSFPTKDLENYLAIPQFPTILKVKRNQFIFQNIGWAKGSVRPTQLHTGEIIKVYGYEWTANGTPRFITNEGYISAHKNYVAPLEKGDKLFALIDIETESGQVIEKGQQVTIEDYPFDQCGEVYVQTNFGNLLLDDTSLAEFTPSKAWDMRISDELRVSKVKASQLKNKKLLLLGVVDFYDAPSLVANKTTYDPKNKERFVDYLDEAENEFGLRFYKTNKGYLIATSDAIQICRRDIHNYVIGNITQVQLLKPLYLYRSVEFNEDTKTGYQFDKNTVLTVLGVSWSNGATPRLEVDGGFITANKKLVRPIVQSNNMNKNFIRNIFTR